MRSGGAQACDVVVHQIPLYRFDGPRGGDSIAAQDPLAGLPIGNQPATDPRFAGVARRRPRGDNHVDADRAGGSLQFRLLGRWRIWKSEVPAARSMIVGCTGSD